MGRVIEITNLSFTYPGESGKALDGVNLDVSEGEFLVICGKSGSGKSTLLTRLKPQIAPAGEESGMILFHGKRLESLNSAEQAQSIGYVMQDPESQIVTDKVWHELAFGPESLGLSNQEIRLRVAEMATYFGINEWFYRDVRELSGGQKQLLNLASVMVMHPQVLVLDEPTSQLDPVAASSFLGTVSRINRDLGTTVIMTEHRLEEAFSIADRAAVMEDGKILYAGTPSAVGEYLRGSRNEMFAAMPVPMRIYAHTDSVLECPVTVRDGRRWLGKVCGSAGSFGSSDGTPERIPGDHNHIPDAGLPQETASDKAIEDAPVLVCRDLWFRYGKDSPDVIRGLDLDLVKGEFYCLLGGNGSGKSTLLSLLCRLEKPYRGKITLAGRKLEKYSDRELYREYLGVLPQDPKALFAGKSVEDELYEMTGGRSEKKNADYHIEMDKSEAVAGIARLTHIDGLLSRHPYDLSGGEQQRLALAKILLLRPRLILMDEPTKGMDAAFKSEFASLISQLKQQKVTIFMISHDIEFAAMYADRCGLLFDGKVTSSGTPREFFTGNSFYTTAANRMAREYFPEAVTWKDVTECLKKTGTVKVF